MKKIKLVTHNDLDGIGCYIVLSSFIGAENIDVSFVDYGDIDKEVGNVIENIDNYMKLFITDISVKDEDVINSICKLVENDENKVTLLDHHKTALELNKYNWAKVCVDIDGRVTCGTELMFKYCKDKGIKKITTIFDIKNCFSKEKITLDAFVELIRRYDTWEWYNVYNDVQSKNLNDLLYILGKEAFIEKFLAKVSMTNSFVLFDDMDKMLIEQRQKEIDSYISKMNERIYDVNVKDYLGGVVFAENFTSELGNELGRLNPKYDFILIIKMSSGGMSFRTVKEDVDVSEIAKLFGGGGHSKASGALLDSQHIVNFLQTSISR